VCEAILDFYGAPHAKPTLAQLVAAVRSSLYEHCTKVLILDDVSRLRMHREADRDALDMLRSLMSMHVTLVLIGVGIPSRACCAKAPAAPAGGRLRRTPSATTTRPPPRPSAASTWWN
jgi:hypothetical protein